MAPTFYEFKQETSRMFAKYGFTHNPLDYRALLICWHMGADLDTAYRLGCDLNAGFTLNESLAAMRRAEEA